MDKDGRPSKETLLQYTYIVMDEKLSGQKTDGSVERELAHAAWAGPDGNIYPHSLHMAKKILGVQNAAECELHMCENGCMLFERADRKAWRAHQNDTCACCGVSRFKVVKSAKGLRLLPRKRYWYFGLKHVLRYCMFADKVWCNMRATACERNEPFTYYTSPEFARLNADTHGLAAHKDTSVYEVGADWGQVRTPEQDGCC